MIETNDLSKQFHDFVAVDGVNLSVGSGQILALLGQNGAGKTTTVRMLTALLQPTRGSARVAGYDVTKNGHDVRASVGVLTEHHGLYMRMTAEEYMDFFGQVYNLDPSLRKTRIENLLEYFGLAEAAKRRIGEYSKGMRQKLALARAMIHEPGVLLLDEPTSAMDPESARLVRDEIARLKSTQRTIMLCSHNLTEVELLADKIAIIYRGRILVQGSLDELKRDVFGLPEYVAQFAAEWDADGLALPKGMELLEKTATRFKVRVEAPGELNPILLKRLADASAPLVSFQEEARTLEQVYLKVMASARGKEHVQ
ncbi:MAG: ABC transporter ATP-binding protein [Chloroflexi bacterium CFX1]|nr:ABC transporter ATP-binding protein [Chloroflexi bacterium CFX1]MCK6568942.1 ABC transporter ATP-binding protein [Anaerolineales bacterium]MDL1918562.1 ABC transporter ATP-binding protein [Chloroflexi bacterium CFX5]NUQ58109.1 ABC transporter ATP-binding protein [Anaerolineales bacterium]